MLQHAADNAVGSFAMLADLFGILPKVLQDVKQIIEIVSIQAVFMFFQILPQLLCQLDDDISKVVDKVERIFNLMGNTRCQCAKRSQLLLSNKLLLGGF